MDGIKGDALALERIEHQLVGGPEVGFGIGIGAKPVLIADQDKEVVRMAAQEGERSDGSRHEAELIVAIYLFVGRLTQDGAVAVDE